MAGEDREIKPCGPPSSSEPMFAHFQLRGRDPEMFARFREKFLNGLEKVLESELNCSTGATVREELQALTSGLLDFAKAKMAQPTAENQRVMAEATEKFAAAKRELAEARKVNAEAESIEIDNRVKKLQLLVKMTKAMIHREDGEAAIVFAKQLDDILLALNEFQQATKSLPSGKPSEDA